MIAEAVWVMLCGIQSALPIFENPALDLAASNAMVTALVLHLPVNDPWVQLSVRGGWCLYGATMPSLAALSVGHLLWARHRLRQRLELTAREPAAIPGVIVERLGRLLETRGSSASC